MSILKIKDDNGAWIGVPTIQGNDGISVVSASINSNFRLILTLSDLSTIDAGSILPTVTSDDNGKVLKVVNGEWQVADISSENSETEIEEET